MLRLTPAVVALALAPALAPANDAPRPPAGFTALFNGRDLTGWQVINGKKEKWLVQDGCIVTGGGGGWLMTNQEYADFELRLEFKLPDGGNSGVAVHAPLAGNPSQVAIEIQVIDDDWHEKNYKGFQPYQHMGSIYGVVPPAKKAQKPIGEWNRMTVRSQGRRLTVELNGTVIVDANRDDLKEHYKAHPGLTRTRGHLGLQDHSEKGVMFRNVFVKAP
jgi:hypothetical protein